MKKLFSVLLIMVLAFSLVACGKKEEDSGKKTMKLAVVYTGLGDFWDMCGVGGSTRYALFRESETRKANTIYSTTLLFGIILGIIMIVIGQLFHYQLAYLVGARGRILTMTSTYIQTVTMFAPAFILNYTTENFIKNDQAPGLAMSASLIGNFANIVLDYILIFPMHMGMRGAALATGMAPLISLTLYGIYMVKEKGTLKIIKGYLYQEIKHIFLLGFPAFFNELADGLIILVFNALLLHYSGNLAVAAYGIVTNVSIIIICILLAFSLWVSISSRSCILLLSREVFQLISFL